MFVGFTIASAAPGDQHRHAMESPLVAQVVNHLEGRFTNRGDNTNVIIAMAAWLTFCLERTISRLKKIGGPGGEEALEEFKKRRNSGCPQAPPQPTDANFEKRVREEVDKIVRPMQLKMAEFGDIEELRKKNDSLEEKNALLEKRIATLEQEKRASDEMKGRFAEKIKELNKTVKVLEEENAALVKARQDNQAIIQRVGDQMNVFDEKHLLLDQLVEKERKEHAETIADFKKKARENHIVKTFLEVKNRSLEHMKTEHEKERKMMQKYREDMIRLLDQKHQALQECQREHLKMVEDFHLEVKLIDRLQAFSEKFDSLEPKDYRTELFASLGKLKPDIADFESPAWIELESQLLVPFLTGKELAKKKKAEGEDLYNQIGDHLARLGIHIDL